MFAIPTPARRAARACRSSKLPVAVLALLAFGLSQAAGADAGLTSQARCRDLIAKGQLKYVKTLFKNAAKCHAGRNSAKVPAATDCNDVTAADLAGKARKAANKLRNKIAEPKSPCHQATDLLSDYQSCPAPAADADDGATSNIDDFGEVGACLVGFDDGLSAPAFALALGSPAAALVGQAADCQKALSQAVTKLVGTYGRERRKCQRSIDKQGGASGYACEGTDPTGKIGRALVALNGRIDAACSLDSATLQEIGACADTAAGLRACVGDDVGSPLGATLAAAAYELLPGGPTTTTSTTSTTSTSVTTTTSSTTTTVFTCGLNHPVCDGSCPAGQVCSDTGAACECVLETGPCEPATILRKFRSRLSPSNALTSMDVGWSGTAHDVDLPEGTGDIMDVTCDANCENCAISSNPLKDHPFGNCRCTEDPTVSCDTINGSDIDDCGGFVDNSCTCGFGAPFPVSSGGTPVCVQNRLANSYSGTMNLRTGDWVQNGEMSVAVYLGISQTSPCPTCDGDPTPNDGVRDGTCNGGVSSGPCDANGVHDTFGATSFDCPPASAANITGNGLQVVYTFSTSTQTLPSNLPCDPPFGDCPCRVCSGDATVGCSNDQICIDRAAGTCTAGGGAGVQPNACNDGICSAAGRCDAGPVDKFCDGITHSDGTGVVSCITDLDCQALGAGACTISDKRRCFPDPIVVDGFPHPVRPVVATIFCIPPTTSTGANASVGMPGPGTIQLDADADIRCQNDPSVVYQLPSGANCVVPTTTTTSTTTTSTLPAIACGTLLPPMCGMGDCPSGQSCVDVGLACACQ